MYRAVTRERERRGWSVRDAATAGGISNTTWGRFEAGAPLTLKMRAAIARAFGWDGDWPVSARRETLAHLLDRSGVGTAERLAERLRADGNDVTDAQVGEIVSGEIAPEFELARAIDAALNAGGEAMLTFGHTAVLARERDVHTEDDGYGLEREVAALRADVIELRRRVDALEGVRHLRAADDDTAGVPSVAVPGERYTRPMPPPEDGDHID